MKLQGHYHVDVFRGDGRYLRGFTLQRVGETSAYRASTTSVSCLRARRP